MLAADETEVKVLSEAMAPVEPVVVARPATMTFPVNEILVDDAYTMVRRPVRVVAPVTPSVLCVEMAPAAVVVALPPTQKAPATETAPVVEAAASEERPVTESVPPVVTLVLMVVAAMAERARSPEATMVARATNAP